ncbi:MAG: cobalamin B12-binding domain-containing protein [Dethiobacteria bacterium]
MNSELLKEAANSILEGNEEKALAVAQKALDGGVDPMVMLSEGFSVGIREVGDRFGRGELFLPELILAAEAMKKAGALLESAIENLTTQRKGKALIATVEGDVHDIGKGIVVALMKTQGIEVYDAGRDVSVDTIIEKAVELNVDIIGTSALLTTTLPQQKKLEEELRKRGIRDNFKTMVGGAPVTQRWADRIGADAFGEDAAEAVNKALALLQDR